MSTTLDPRIFVGIFATGIGYADREREKHGDYARLAILFFSDLRAEFDDDCPADLRTQIEADMARYQARAGDTFQVTTSGQTIVLGHNLRGTSPRHSD